MAEPIILTPREIMLARHALGLDYRRSKSYRNHFVTDPNCDDGKVWEAMVAKGAARKRPTVPIYGGDTCYHLTLAGAKAAIKDGERLDLSDFPGALGHD